MKNSYWTYSIENVTKQLRFLYLLYCYYLICEETTLSIFDQKFNRTVENPILAILFILWRNHIELRHRSNYPKKEKNPYIIHIDITLRQRYAQICAFSNCPSWSTECSLNIVLFSVFFKTFRTLFSLGVSVCTHTRQVENQRCSRTGRVQKNHKILRKKHNN